VDFPSDTRFNFGFGRPALAFASDFSSGFWLSSSGFAFSSGFWLLASGFVSLPPCPSSLLPSYFVRYDPARNAGL
jgi:hypothetical protein